jgi:hypothetical protein
MREMLDQQTVDGTLRWSRAFYDHEIAVPPRWSEQPCGYVQLSAAYDADDAEAIARGGPPSG